MGTRFRRMGAGFPSASRRAGSRRAGSLVFEKTAAEGLKTEDLKPTITPLYPQVAHRPGRLYSRS